jgi:selenocysteine-specific translation elongation factor
VVAAIQLTGSVKVGDKVVIKGHSSNVELTIASMQIHNGQVTEAKAGDGVGVKVPDRVRKGDAVYKVVD